MKRFFNVKALVLSFVFLTAISLPGTVKGQVYKKVTSTPASWNGTYLIVYESGQKIAGGKSDQGNYLHGVGAVINNQTITGDYSACEVIVAGDNIKRGDTCLYHQTTGSNNFSCWFYNNSNCTKWSYSTDGISYSSIVSIKWYSSFFRCTHVNGTKAVLYRRQPEKKEILGAGTEDNNRYYLIASPVTTLTPSTDNGFLREDGDVDYYDLYSFDQSNDDEWRNYKASSFNLVSGKGYLYANKDDVALVFDGAFRYRKNMTVNLAYTAGKKLAGWNLIGNPYDVTAYLTDGRDFYRMNAAGDGFEAASGSINKMEGVFVQATGTGQSVTFTTTAPSSKDANNQRVELNIIGSDDNVIDRAIVRFGEGGTLSKLVFRENNTKIYIPKADGDYAVVRSNGLKNIPVNFKASKMGRYTITVETEGLNLNYLHLIDRLTEEDIDLLKENKYSFIASTVDNEARFVLAFSANGDDDVYETFAYQSGSDIIVRGEGELQIFDVMGRMVATHHVSGVETLEKPSSNGVYIFRLNEKVQKIVVK